MIVPKFQQEDIQKQNLNNIAGSFDINIFN